MLAPIQMSSRRLRRSQRGATAIEYAIIAGLIGLGLVGSLATTRGSLSSIFGTASSQMGSSSAAQTAGPSGSAITGTSRDWDAKTVLSKTLNPYGSSGKELWVKYTDGTEAVYRTGQGSPFDRSLILIEPNGAGYKYIYYDPAGKLNYYQEVLLSNGQYVRTDSASLPNFPAFSGDPPVPPSHKVNNYSGGQLTSTSEIAVDAAWIAKTQAGAKDYKYFSDMLAKQ